MALSFANPAETGEKFQGCYQIPGGLKIRIVDMTTSDATADYSSGFDLQTNAGKLGFHRIIGVLAAELRSTADVLRSLVPTWQPDTGKLRFYKTLGGVTPTEAVADTDLIDADVLRLVLIGV